jgi:hypothetical protein
MFEARPVLPLLLSYLEPTMRHSGDEGKVNATLLTDKDWDICWLKNWQYLKRFLYIRDNSEILVLHSLTAKQGWERWHWQSLISRVTMV